MSPVLGAVGPLFLAIVFVFFLVVLGIGYYGYRTTNTEDDFLVAGRSIGPIVGGTTLSATQMSAGTFIGTIGVHYLTGVSYVYIWIGLWLGWLVSLVFVAPKIRRFGELTVPDFLVARFGRGGRSDDYFRALSAVLIFGAYTVYISAQYTGAGLVFESMFGVSRNTGMVLMVVIVLIYTTLGGMRASALTDFVQFIIMLAGAVVALPQIFQYIGGFEALNATLTAVQPSLTGWGYTPIEVGTIAAAFGFGMIGAPYELTRVYSMRDEKTVRQAIGLTLIYQVIIATSVALIGMGMRVMFPELGTPDLASIIMSINVLGPVLGAMVVTAILSAMLSTVDSIMIVSAGALAHDLYAQLLNPNASERRKLWVNRLSTVVVGVVPLVLALTPGVLGGLVQFIVILQTALIGASFSIPVLIGLNWKRANLWGAALGMVGGFLTVIVWHFLQSDLSGILSQIDPVVPGVIVSLLGLFIGSYATAPPESERLERFFDI